MSWTPQPRFDLYSAEQIAQAKEFPRMSDLEDQITEVAHASLRETDPYRARVLSDAAKALKKLRQTQEEEDLLATYVRELKGIASESVPGDRWYLSIQKDIGSGYTTSPVDKRMVARLSHDDILPVAANLAFRFDCKLDQLRGYK